MGTKGRTKIFAVLAGLLVAAFSLFAALWVNGNIPLPAATATSFILGMATFLATIKDTARKCN
jgi:HAMP domain-containing protein